MELGRNSTNHIRIATGGPVKHSQMIPIGRGCNMLIGTPGRVWEFVYLKKWIDFSEVRLVIIDEADCTFVGSYLTHVEEILKHSSMPIDYQLVSFSATLDDRFLQFLYRVKEEYETINCGVPNTPSKTIMQDFVIANVDTLQQLVSIVENHTAYQKVVIYCCSYMECLVICRELSSFRKVI